MLNDFNKCLEVVLKEEGGFVNNPADPGGATNFGITKKTYESWIGHTVTVQDIKNLTVAEITPLYHQKYWNAIQADQYPSGVDLVVFDFAVNSGVNRAIRYLQMLVNTPADGVVGPATIAAVNAYVAANGKEKLIKEYQLRRMNFLRQLSTFATFGNGWTQRVSEIQTAALTI